LDGDRRSFGASVRLSGAVQEVPDGKPLNTPSSRSVSETHPETQVGQGNASGGNNWFLMAQGIYDDTKQFWLPTRRWGITIKMCSVKD
jgi:hypothetical protein